MATNKHYKIDVPKLYKYFGGTVIVQQILELRGHDISVKAVEKWRERGSIPSWALVELVGYSIDEGRELRLSDYMTMHNYHKVVSRIERDYEPDAAMELI